MNRVVNAGRTRMYGGHLCIGGHDLDDHFSAVRLLDWYGDHWPMDVPFEVGQVWMIHYQRKASARRPHVEDAIVHEFLPTGESVNLRALVLRRVRPWSGPPHALFDATVRGTPSGAPYIPVKGRLPRCSTGYWLPAVPLERHMIGTRVQFIPAADGEVKKLTWVGVQRPPERIEAGSLVRVSLSRLYHAETAPEGYYVQLSGVL